MMDVDEVILAGGHARWPAIEAGVQEMFQKKPHIADLDAAARGAAIYAAAIYAANMMEGEPDMLLVDVTPYSLSVDGDRNPLIKMNKMIPCKETSQTFTTTEDNQTFVDVCVVYRYAGMANSSQRCFRFGKLLPTQAGKPRIAITVDIEADQTLKVSAEDVGTGEELRCLREFDGTD